MAFGPNSSGDREVRPALALRATLRAFAGLFDLQDGEGPTYSRADLEQLLTAALRTVIVHWIHWTYGGVAADRLERADAWLRERIAVYDDRRPAFYQQNIMGSDYAVGAREQNLDAARRVLALVSEIGGEALPSPQDLRTANPKPFETFSIFGPESWTHGKRWAELLSHSIAADGELLKRMTARELLLSPLWVDPAGDSMEVHLGEAHWSLFTEQRWLHREVVAFLRERRGGKLVLGNPPEQMSERMRAIAALPDVFWQDRIAEDVNANLAYCFHGEFENAAWGDPKPSMTREVRERFEAMQREREQSTAQRHSTQQG